ncbi:hypothetical protein AB9K41_05500 [Cribrihabitans sp. XS_ASV171]
MLRQTDLTNDGSAATVEFFAQEEQSFDTETAHLLEDVNGLAFESAGLFTGYEMPVDDLVFV